MTYHDYYILQYDMLYAWIFFGCHDCHASFPDSTDCTTKSLQVTGPDGGGVGLVLRSGGIALPQPEETQGLSRRCHGAMVPWCHGAMARLNGRSKIPGLFRFSALFTSRDHFTKGFSLSQVSINSHWDLEKNDVKLEKP